MILKRACLVLLLFTSGRPAFAEATEEIPSAVDTALYSGADRDRRLVVAAHPHAAVLFYDFMISDGQEILAKREISRSPAEKSKRPSTRRPLPLSIRRSCSMRIEI